MASVRVATPVARFASSLLFLAVVQNVLYEGVWRGLVHRGVSEFDGPQVLVNALVASAIVATVAVFVRRGARWASGVGIAYSLFVLAGTVFVYFPEIYLAREPGVVENLATTTFVALYGAAAALLAVDLVATRAGAKAGRSAASPGGRDAGEPARP